MDSRVTQETVRRWICQADVDVGFTDGMTNSEQPELVRSRRDRGRLEMEN